MFWGCLWQEIFGGNLFEEVASQEIFFCNDIYVGTNNHEKKTSNYCRLLILRYLLQMEVYSPLYILPQFGIKDSYSLSLGKESLRVVKAMPKWYPGLKNGKAVKVKCSIPITFHL